MPSAHLPSRLPSSLRGPPRCRSCARRSLPLAKKLASRMAAKRRRAARGEIDIRKTLRRSMSTGGVPIRPALRRRSPHRPDLVLLCDLSSSVTGFSRFTILLMQAMAGQFRRIRIFGFVNVCDELTETVLSAPPGSDLTAAFTDTARMTRWHRNSDYGTALVDFTDRYLDAVGHRTTVLILGDARTNNTEPRLDALAEIVARAKRVDWLNPEPPSQWGTGDSVAHLYGQIVDMHECANAVQLRQFVMRLMPV
ncbi:MAG: VWA domain-containing protein [Microthrixaceae bacterium]